MKTNGKLVCPSSKAITDSNSSDQILDLIRTKPRLTGDGKPFDYVVQGKVAKGEYRLECIPADIVGTARPIEVYRAKRAKSNSIIY